MNKQTEATRRRYDRVARLYDLSEWVIERLRYTGWRELVWSKIEGTKVLEVGVGTGANIPYYPPGITVTAVDLSPRMIQRARARAQRLGHPVEILVMDAQDLGFPDNSFDSVVATFVFCSVPDPVRGLEEIRRVCRPGGKVVLLEHVRSANAILGGMMDLVNPLVTRISGSNINRETVSNIRRGGLLVEQVTDLWAGIFKLIEARKGAA